jgi:hypothetical protein
MELEVRQPGRVLSSRYAPKTSGEKAAPDPRSVDVGRGVALPPIPDRKALPAEVGLTRDKGRPCVMLARGRNILIDEGRLDADRRLVTPAQIGSD